MAEELDTRWRHSAGDETDARARTRDEEAGTGGPSGDGSPLSVRNLRHGQSGPLWAGNPEFRMKARFRGMAVISLGLGSGGVAMVKTGSQHNT